MFIKAKETKGYKLNVIDGEIGKVKEYYFDDKFWTIRYLVADTGGWLSGKQVLISPYNLISVNVGVEYIEIDLTKKQIEDSPLLDSDKPVSQQYEESFYGYYGAPIYWGGAYMWGLTPGIVRNRENWTNLPKDDKSWDPHLRSTSKVSGYNIQANDGEIGHVDDFIIDEETWAIRYLIVDTANWLPGKKVLISTQWIDRISWDEAKVFIDLSRESVEKSPEFTDMSLIPREYEADLHRHYNKERYWSLTD